MSVNVVGHPGKMTSRAFCHLEFTTLQLDTVGKVWKAKVATGCIGPLLRVSERVAIY
jgi:hypothetical protein